MANTADRFAKAMKETWTEDHFKKAFDMEIQGSLIDLRQQTRRQITGRAVQPMFVFDHVPVSHTGWQNQAHLATIKRKGKPSYRQRQKNGRAGRK